MIHLAHVITRGQLAALTRYQAIRVLWLWGAGEGLTAGLRLRWPSQFCSHALLWKLHPGLSVTSAGLP